MGKVVIHAPKTPVTKGSNTIAMASVPNVCKMPGPPAPFVPVPLPNAAKSSDSPKGFSKKVKFEGNTVAIKGATFKSMGDVASKGTGGGLVSANTHGPAKFIAPGSMTVKVEGKNVHLLGDSMLNNCGPSGNPPNAATLMGAAHGPGLPSADPSITCLWCGEPLDDHDTLATDDKKLGQAAVVDNKGRGKKVGAMTVDGGPIMKKQSGGGFQAPVNLATGREIPMTAAQQGALRDLGFELGNCAEQQLLHQHFVRDGNPYPPPGSGIKMGISRRIKGTPTAKEAKKAKHEPKCGTCQRVMKMMLCTNDQAEPEEEGEGGG